MSGPECPRFGTWIDDALDGRLAAPEAEALAAHLLTCDGCRALDEQLRWVRASLRDALAADRDASLEARLRAALADGVVPAPGAEPAARRFTRRRVVAVALAAGLAGLSWWWWRRPAARSGDTSGELVSELRDHERDPLPRGFSPLAADALEARFAAAGLGFPARVIDLSAMGVRVLGGSTKPFAGRPATLVLYELPAGRMLCRMVLDPTESSIVPATTPALRERGFEFVTTIRDGASLVFWREGPVACVLVARLPVDDLLDLARQKAMAAAA